MSSINKGDIIISPRHIPTWENGYSIELIQLLKAQIVAQFYQQIIPLQNIWFHFVIKCLLIRESLIEGQTFFQNVAFEKKKVLYVTRIFREF